MEGGAGPAGRGRPPGQRVAGRLFRVQVQPQHRGAAAEDDHVLPWSDPGVRGWLQSAVPERRHGGLLTSMQAPGHVYHPNATGGCGCGSSFNGIEPAHIDERPADSLQRALLLGNRPHVPYRLAVIIVYFALTLCVGLWSPVRSAPRGLFPWRAGFAGVGRAAVCRCHGNFGVSVISIPGVGARGDLTSYSSRWHLIGRSSCALAPARLFQGEQETSYARLETRFGPATRRWLSTVSWSLVHGERRGAGLCRSDSLAGHRWRSRTIIAMGTSR